MREPHPIEVSGGETPGPAWLRGRFFYGWVVVASCLLVSSVLWGIRYSFGVFFKSLEAEFGWTRAMTSGVFAIHMILASLFAIIGGWALDRYGPKVVVVIMGMVTGISLFLTGRVEHVWQLYLAYSLLLALGSGASYIVVMSTGSRWFLRQRATALAIIGTGAGLGTLIMAPVAAQLISAYNWRASFLALAVIAWALVIPAALFLKKEPAEIGALPDGDREPAGLSENTAAGIELRYLSLVEALKTHSFWLLFLTWFAYSFCLHLVMTHVVPRALDLGIPPVQAAAIVSVIGAVSIPSRLIVGRISDKVGKRVTGIVCALLHTLALLWLISSTRVWMFHLFAVAYGIGYGGIDPPIVALIGDLFGLRRVGVIMGSLVVGWGLGAALGPYLTGLIFDLSNSYSLAFLAGALIMVMAAVSISRLKSPAQRP
ncbi:MAG TPA: MFS transporter [Dehalococcoidia bacterium]|nr:MFS transporter [Dehalococcoidia bacterium]